WIAGIFGVLLALGAVAAQGQPAPPADPLRPLAFLEGTWAAAGKGPQGAAASGSYAFERQLNGHVLMRRIVSKEGCSGPASFDCLHSDFLAVYQDGPGRPLRALYLDNEGHTIHYVVNVVSPNSVELLSEPAAGGSGSMPQFRLLYEREGEVMTGRF